MSENGSLAHLWNIAINVCCIHGQLKMVIIWKWYDCIRLFPSYCLLVFSYVANYFGCIKAMSDLD